MHHKPGKQCEMNRGITFRQNEFSGVFRLTHTELMLRRLAEGFERLETVRMSAARGDEDTQVQIAALAERLAVMEKAAARTGMLRKPGKKPT